MDSLIVLDIKFSNIIYNAYKYIMYIYINI